MDKKDLDLMELEPDVDDAVLYSGARQVINNLQTEIESLRSRLAETIEKAATYSLRVVELEGENEKLRKNADRSFEMMDKINELRRENERLRDTLNRERNRSQS